MNRFRWIALAGFVVVLLVAGTLATPHIFLSLGDRSLAAADFPDAELQYDRAYRTAILHDPQLAAYWGRGQARFKQSAYEPAIADFDVVIAAQPLQNEAHRLRGTAHFHLKHYPEAIADLDIVIAEQPALSEECRLRGTAHFILQHYSEAIADLNVFLDAVPGNSDALAMRGYAHLQLKHYAETVSDLSAYLVEQPNQPDPLAQRGTAHFHLGATDAAIADLQAAVNLKTSQMEQDRALLAEAYYRRAQKAAKEGRYGAVADDLALGFFADATRPEMHSLRAFADLQLDHFGDAVTDATDAIALDKQAWEAYAYRAAALAASGSWQRAGDDADTALAGKLEPRERALALYARALSGGAQERFAAAIRDAGEALSLGTLDLTRTVTVHLVRADAYIEGESYALASADYEKALKLEPSGKLRLVLHGGAGWAHLVLDEFDAAIEDFGAAIRLAPDDEWLYAQRGLAHSANKSYRDAIADYDRALALNPRLAVAYSNRGVARSALHEYETAIADFEKAADLSDDADLRNRARSYALLANAAIHGQRAETAIDEFDELTKKGTGKGAEETERFQKNFAAARDRLRAVQNEVGLMAEQYGEIEKLDLPDWFLAFAAKSRQSLEKEREGFAIVEQLWVKTNTLVTILPRLAEQLEKAADTTTFSKERFQRIDALLDRRDYAGARAVTEEMRAELRGFRDSFDRVRRESGMGFIADAVQFFERQIELVDQFDEIIAAVQASDLGRYQRAIARTDALESEVATLSKRMANWDVELERWFARNIKPLIDQASAKFDEARTLGKEAAAIFDEAPKKLVTRTPRRNFPPPWKS